MYDKTWYRSVILYRPQSAVVILYVVLLSSFRVVDGTLKHALVTGTEGTILGQIVQEAAIFRGIPFSQPPIGEWRWKRPRNPIPYESDLWNATYARPECPQICDPSLKKYICFPTMSEDCLYLNIWIPRRVLQVSEKSHLFPQKHYTVDEGFMKKDSESLSVMFYLHGGNFIMGSGSATLYDGRFLASRGDVIVVTTNYRLGAIGFLAQHDEKDVNFGILDQMQALKWVRSNIAAFGGNPNKITVVGQSAGAESVGILLTSPYADNLFQRAVIQSDPWSIPYRTLPEAQMLADKLSEEVGCEPKNITCLKSRSANHIVHAASKIGGFGLGNQVKILVAFQMWGPVIDGDLITRLPILSFIKGEFRHVPLIIGTDKDDGLIFISGAFTHPLGELIYDAILQFIGGKLGTSVADDYPPCTPCDNRKQLSKIATDYAFLCPGRKLSFKTGNNTWSYIFNASMPWKTIYEKFNCMKEVCHGSELPYLFDTVSLTDLTPFDTEDAALSHAMQRYWTNFIKYGNPNGVDVIDGPSTEHWERFSHGNDASYNILELSKSGNVMVQNASDKTCDFWDDLNVYGKY